MKFNLFELVTGTAACWLAFAGLSHYFPNISTWAATIGGLIGGSTYLVLWNVFLIYQHNKSVRNGK